ncbi:MAG: hypothetical protein AAGB26_07715 [Planctomycetota bacterium]
MSNPKTPTLGQRIDEVLEPLYAEAEQHRATIALVKQQQQSLQEQLDDATQGLGEIESRMAEVVRSLAQQEPVIAAVCGQTAAASTIEGTATPVEAIAGPAAVTVEAEAEGEPATEAPAPQPDAEPTPIQDTAEAAEPEPASIEEATEPEPVAETPGQAVAPTDEEPTIEHDPVADAAAVNEAAALLDGPPEQEGEAEEEPKVDLAAAAERAAAAAKQLREKAGSK